MGKFFDNVTGRQKVVLLMGGFILIIGASALFPNEVARLGDFIGEIFSSAMQLFQGGE